ncbi:MAG: hypothetical protein KDA60_07400, partial [Planctomycetales bacterium]|nr:hypothetical protein [Planctomycetales bacterium]
MKIITQHGEAELVSARLVPRCHCLLRFLLCALVSPLLRGAGRRDLGQRFPGWLPQPPFGDGGDVVTAEPGSSA